MFTAAAASSSSSFAVAAVALFAAVSVSAQETNSTSTAANATAVALIEAQWDAAGLNTPIGNGQALGQPLDAQALLEVIYGSSPIVTGQAYAADAVAERPNFQVMPVNPSNWSAEASYTLALVDFSSISDPDPRGEYRHYLNNGVQVAAGEIDLSTGTLVTSYAGPGPLPGTGPHRYAWLLYEQPSTFAAPANLSTAGTAAGPWDFAGYVTESGLGPLVAANFFTVENGAPTVPAASTEAVNTATLSVESAASSSAGSPTSAANGGAGNAASSPSSAASPAPTGAASSTFAPAGAMLAAVAGLVAFLA